MQITSKETLLHWLERTGRLKLRQSDAHPDSQILEELDDIIDPDNYAIEEEEEEEEE
jgi:Tfp pilus assembly protein PilN